MNINAQYALIVLAGLLAASPASSQANSQGCTPQERDGQTPSQKLGQTNGVICPPDIDPAIKAPTPEGGKTPVIPPPGSPGGNPQVQPK
jgi:hypothetical protein